MTDKVLPNDSKILRNGKRKKTILVINLLYSRLEIYKHVEVGTVQECQKTMAAHATVEVSEIVLYAFLRLRAHQNLCNYRTSELHENSGRLLR